ncbi:hypothetical protein D3C78_1092270 [compost metagenome]
MVKVYVQSLVSIKKPFLKKTGLDNSICLRYILSFVRLGIKELLNVDIFKLSYIPCNSDFENVSCLAETKNDKNMEIITKSFIE